MKTIPVCIPYCRYARDEVIQGTIQVNIAADDLAQAHRKLEQALQRLVDNEPSSNGVPASYAQQVGRIKREEWGVWVGDEGYWSAPRDGENRRKMDANKEREEPYYCAAFQSQSDAEVAVSRRETEVGVFRSRLLKYEARLLPQASTDEPVSADAAGWTITVNGVNPADSFATLNQGLTEPEDYTARVRIVAGQLSVSLCLCDDHDHVKDVSIPLSVISRLQEIVAGKA